MQSLGFALKLILNAISTGANIMKGKVFRNTMINLTVAITTRYVSTDPIEFDMIYSDMLI